MNVPVFLEGGVGLHRFQFQLLAVPRSSHKCKFMWRASHWYGCGPRVGAPFCGMLSARVRIGRRYTRGAFESMFFGTYVSESWQNRHVLPVWVFFGGLWYVDGCSGWTMNRPGAKIVG